MSDRRSAIIWSAATALLYTILAWLQPYALDDLTFRHFFDAFRDAPSFSQFFNDAAAAVVHQYHFDSLRLSNAAVSLLMLFPIGVPATALGVSIYITLMVAWRLSGKNIVALGLFSACYFLLPPWWDGMLTKAFAFNYVVSSAIALGVCVCVLNNRLNTVAALLLGLLAGMWHEGFSVALCGGIVCLLVFNPEFRNKRTIAWLIGVTAGILILLLAPGTRFRGDGMFMPVKLVQLQYGLLTGAPFYIFIALTGIYLLKKRILSPTVTLLAGCAAGGWVVWRCFMTDYRTAWPMLLFACCGLAYLAAQTKLSKWRVAGNVLLATAVLQLILCLPYALRLHREYRDAFEAAADGMPGHFTSRSTSAKTPRYTLNRINYDIYLRGGYPVWQCVPAELADYNPSEAGTLCGNTHATLYKGLIVVPGHELGESAWICTLTAGDRSFETVCLFSPFSTPEGEFCYAAPLDLYRLAGAREITSFNLIRPDL